MNFLRISKPNLFLQTGLLIGLLSIADTAEAQMGPSMMSTAAYTQNVVTGHMVSFHGTASSATTMGYQWQVSTNNAGAWANMMDDTNYRGTATDTLTVMSAAAGMNGYQYRMVATNTAGSANSAAFTMNVMTAVLGGPSGLAFDPAGNCWISDGSTNVIQKMTTAGLATMMAGAAGQQGSANGTGAAATFRQPGGMAFDAAGNVYVADTGNSLIRMVSPTGVVTTTAGSSAHQDYKDGTGADAWFNAPACLTLDKSGNIYVADTGNAVIRMITPSGVVTTIAGMAGMKGAVDGTGAAAHFNQPAGIAMDAAGMLYVADTMNQTIRKITPSAVVTTLAGLMGVSGTSDGKGSSALFNQPMGMTFDGSGNMYVADYGNSAIRMITPAGMVSTLAGLNSVSGMMDGMGMAAWFNMPKDVKYDGKSALYVADYGNAEIRQVSLQGSVSTMTLSQSAPATSPGTGSTSSPTVGTISAMPMTSSGGGGAVGLPFLSALAILSGLRFWRRPGRKPND